MNIINPAFAGIKDSPELNLVYRSQYIGIDDAQEPFLWHIPSLWEKILD